MLFGSTHVGAQLDNPKSFTFSLPYEYNILVLAQVGVGDPYVVQVRHAKAYVSEKSNGHLLVK